MDSTITKIEAAVLQGTRPRVIGRNARLGVHGQFPRDAVARLHSDDGPLGWGWSRAKPEDAKSLIGKCLRDVFSPETWTSDDFLPFDFPLWDAAGRALGQPVYEMLGGGGVHPVPVYDGSIYMDEIDPDTGRDDGLQPMLDAVQAGWDAGFRGFKVKVGRGHMWMEKKAGLKRDIDVLRAIRERIGPDAHLLIDANNGYTPDEARDVMRQAGDCDIYWFEEPFPEDIEETVALKRFIAEGGWDTLIADGEGSGRRDEEFTEIVRAGGVDVVQFDLRGYSLTKWVRYMAIIDETGTLYAPHNWGSHLSGFYIPQMARGCAGFAMGETDIMEMPAVVADGYELSEGWRNTPDAPGFGLELNEAEFAEALRRDESWTVAI